MTRHVNKSVKTSKRGLIEFNEQPSQEWLEANNRFSFKGADGLRITFYRRHRKGRNPTWNGTVHRKGKSYTAYAGTSKSFDLEKVYRALSAKVSST